MAGGEFEVSGNLPEERVSRSEVCGEGQRVAHGGRGFWLLGLLERVLGCSGSGIQMRGFGCYVGFVTKELRGCR